MYVYMHMYTHTHTHTHTHTADAALSPALAGLYELPSHGVSLTVQIGTDIRTHVMISLSRYR
jgi:hypothetical protein